MHPYVDGKAKPATLIVGPWAYIALKPGKHRLRVTLNANTHAEYHRNGNPVQNTAMVRVKD